MSIHGSLCLLSLPGMVLDLLWYSHEQAFSAFRHGRVRKHGVSQGRVRQPGDHCKLDRTHEFSSLGSKASESENTVVVCLDQRLHEPTFFRNRPGPPTGFDRHGRKAIGNTPLSRLRLVESNTCQLRINENAIWYQPVSRAAVASVQVFVDDRKVVLRYVGEVGAARTFSHRPNTRCRGFQAIVHADVSRFNDI